MAVYLLDGRLCPALFLDELDPDGNPTRAVYAYKSTEASGPVEWRTTNSLVLCPADNGASWTAANFAHGANFYLIVPDDTNLQHVLDRLLEAHANRDRAAADALGGAVHGETDPGVSSIFASPATEAAVPQDDRPLWQKLGFDSKAAWRDAGSPRP